MMRFGSPQSETGDEVWKYRLDCFARENERELAALAWAFYCDRGDTEEMLGIDLKPEPHLISFSREAIERLNRNVRGQIQEILGLLDGHQPEKEVLYLAIGDGQIKLINFARVPPPPDCFEAMGLDLTALLDAIEERLSELLLET